MARKKKWSYNAGERGRNWVRAYCKGCIRPCSRNVEHSTGSLYLEWRDYETTPSGTSRGVRRCKIMKGVVTVEEAKRRADKLAAEFGKAPKTRFTAVLTLRELLRRYVAHATPRKGESKQGHDGRAERVWIAFLDAQKDSTRRSNRTPASLDRLDWEDFVHWRRNGLIPGWPAKVRDKIISDDLQFLVTVFTWAVGLKLLESNPWSGDVRRAQGWSRVKEVNPHRPGMTDRLRDLLIANSTSWQFAAALRLERETRRRNSAIRMLRWSDVNFEKRTIHWRAETDKCGRENTTPMTVRTLEILRSLPSRGIGDAPLFPSATDSLKPSTRDAFQQWLKRAKARLLKSVADPAARGTLREELRGVGFHAEKRAGVRDREFRNLPASVQAEYAGTEFDTLLKIYDEVTTEDIREAWPDAQMA